MPSTTWRWIRRWPAQYPLCLWAPKLRWMLSMRNTPESIKVRFTPTTITSSIAWLCETSIDINFSVNPPREIIIPTGVLREKLNCVQVISYYNICIVYSVQKSWEYTMAITKQTDNCISGQLRSRSNRVFRLKGQTIDTPFTVETTIDFNECIWRPRDFARPTTLRLKVLCLILKTYHDYYLLYFVCRKNRILCFIK